MSALAVYLAGERAGTLIRKDNGNLQFRYGDGYKGPAVSQAMPPQTEAHPHRVCVAVFGGLLLEGEPREVLARNLGVSPGNDFALLEDVGGDCAGAITLLAPESPLPSVPEVKPVSPQELNRLLRELPQRPLAASPQEGIRLSLAGAQPKLPVILEGEQLGLPLNAAAASTHIIKPEPTRFPGLVDNEAFCMSLARAVELPVATVNKHTTISEIPYLLVERYDRDVTADPIRRLHQEDVCQALGRPSEFKYQAEGGPTVAETVGLLRSASTVPARDLPTLWRALVFNWLIGNCDAHGKNFSLLYDGRSPTLAPLYDLVSTTSYPELTTRLAMSIDGASRIDEVDEQAWQKLAAQTGYSGRFAADATRTLVERTLREAERLGADPAHDNATVTRILAGIRARSLRARS
ncbi:MAG TPA: type II toxin-antitoxin system HipA family toxin [Solirubrobacteraceae bacterium]|nr:type II toxin-antitoxin system HipA family toxin [Solirubrobacteraceae bacterium]